MKIISSLRNLNLTQPAVVAIGKFDGVHIGHQAILQAALAEKVAQQQQGFAEAVVVALSFHPLPSMFFNPQGNLKLLTAPQERHRLMKQAGADIGVLLTFDAQTASLSAEEFIELLLSHLNMTAMVMGQDFALGHNRVGTGEVLQAWGPQKGFRVSVVEDVRCEGYVIRSHTIRELLGRGDVRRAALHLGRTHFISGRVVEGVKLARRLGFPTANLETRTDRGYPLGGVYATRTWISEPFGVYDSVTNLGYRPTFNGTEYRFETHLLDFPDRFPDDHLYGQRIAVAFVERLRSECRFASVEDLCRQVDRDILAARAILPDEPADAREAEIMQALLASQAQD